MINTAEYYQHTSECFNAEVLKSNPVERHKVEGSKHRIENSISFT